MRLIYMLALLFITTAAHAELPSSNDAAIKTALASGKPSIVDFGARSCIPCKKMAPILEGLNRELTGKANVLFVDVWKDNSIGRRYRVQMIPTQIFFDAKGNEIKRHMGFMDKSDLLKELNVAGLK